MIVDGGDGPGPAEYDRVRVIQHGPEDAENVLVLEPGTSAGVAYFSPVMLDIVNELPRWQVWSVDRRENLLEDHFEPRGGLAGDDDSAAFAREWGMSLTIDDLHAVIQEAVGLGGEVVLGGHSLGGSITVAYATWDFDGRPGADDLSGLVLIDGGSGVGPALTVDEAHADLNDLASGSPFNDITLVDEGDRLSHTDPMGVATEENPLVDTLVPFLRDLV